MFFKDFHKIVCLTLLLFSALLFVYPTQAISQDKKENPYKLKPFKLKRKAPIVKEKNAFQELQLKSTLDSLPPIKKIVSIGFKVGYPFVFNYPKTQPDFRIPYLGFTYRANFPYRDTNFYYEYEIGYFGLKSYTQNYEDIIQNIPLTISVLYQAELNDWLILTPKIGAGPMMIYTKNDFLADELSLALVLKPGLEISFKVDDNLFITLDNSLLITQRTGDTFLSALSYYYIPTLGIRYQYELTEDDQQLDSISFRIGYVFPFGSSYNDPSLLHPYVGLAYRNNFKNSKRFFYEFEIGYFGLEDTQTNYSSMIYAFPLTFSVVYSKKLNDWLTLNPKLGLGSMVSFNNVKDNKGNSKNNLSTFLILKAGVELLFKLEDNFFLVLDNSFTVAQNTNKYVLEQLDYYYNPSLGINYYFEAAKKFKQSKSVSIRSGYVFALIDEQTNLLFPYLGFTYRTQFSKRFHYEFEMGQFMLESSGIKYTYLPITFFNLVYHGEIIDWLILNPRIGVGNMLAFTISDTGSVNPYFFFTLKPGLETTFKVAKNFFIFLDNSLLIAFNITRAPLSNDIDFYYIPSLGVRFQF